MTRNHATNHSPRRMKGWERESNGIQQRAAVAPDSTKQRVSGGHVGIDRTADRPGGELLGDAALVDSALDPKKSPQRTRRLGGAAASEEAGQATARTTQQTNIPVSTSKRPRMGARRATGQQQTSNTSRQDSHSNTPGGGRARTPGTRQAGGGYRMGRGATRRGDFGESALKPAASSTSDSSADRGSQKPLGNSKGSGAKPPSQWRKQLSFILGILLTAAILIMVARWIRTFESVQVFLTTYSGHTDLPDSAAVGIPGWVGWQHFFNMFLLVLIVKSGLQVRLERKPHGYWKPKNNSFFAPKNSSPKKVSLSQWLHQSLDVLWVLNGLIFIVLLFVTGHWVRIVPLSWDIFPHMVSAGLQYLSLDWPTEHGWVHYNALQVMAYFVTVFIAAPVAVISGVRISTWWPDKNKRLSRYYPVELARALHFPVLLYFVAFTGVHIFLVFFTGVLRNLNHVYTSRDVVDGWGLMIFLLSLLSIAGGWFLTKPLFTTSLAARSGNISR